MGTRTRSVVAAAGAAAGRAHDRGTTVTATCETGPQFTTTLQRVGWTRAWSGDAGLGFQDLTVRIAPTP